jgi:diguanylate cyclase (GGDEF)-like protein
MNAPRTPVLPSWQFLALSLGIGAGVLAFAAGLWWQLRDDTWNRAISSTQSVRVAVASDLARSFNQIDLSLLETVERLRSTRVTTLPPQDVHQLLFDRGSDADFIEAMAVANADGQLLYDSRQSNVAGLANIANREYFTTHRLNTSPRLFISPPFEGDRERVGPVVALSRRIVGSEGTFQGIVVAFLRLDYIEQLFSQLLLGDSGIIALLMTDGTVLMRYPNSDAYIGKTLRNENNFARMTAERSGSFAGRSQIDGVERLFSFQRVGRYPLILNIGLSVDELMAPSDQKALLFGPVVILLVASLIALALLLRREFRRRADAEQHLALAATIDVLTGVPNRRAFDEALQREWAQARRVARPVSLLMVDVDHFKTINDRLGHRGGDVVLAQVAARIAREARRPLDFAARWGGEEFALLLPDTTLPGAVEVAERVRTAIADLEVAALSGPITVSIGIATQVPAGTAEDGLVGAADEALYNAKRNGRDRIEIAGCAGPPTCSAAFA